MEPSDFAAVENYLRTLQDGIVNALSKKETRRFDREDWNSPLGQGTMWAVQEGSLLERGGVNFSAIAADQLPTAASVRYPSLAGKPYRACGVSLVLHPLNPYCPTVHLNVRFFDAGEIWWFGGGMDLTPHYGFVEDCRHFHRTCQQALDARDNALYPRFKKQCDDYFFIRHRNETRGIGGVFFDDFNEQSFAHAFSVLRAVGDAFLPAYLPIIDRRQALDYGEHERQWQQHRRGRYVEFNLVYDRGTLFGLQAGGRAEAILMSLPPTVRWGSFVPTAKEKALAENFLPPRDWTIAGEEA